MRRVVCILHRIFSIFHLSLLSSLRLPLSHLLSDALLHCQHRFPPSHSVCRFLFSSLYSPSLTLFLFISLFLSLCLYLYRVLSFLLSLSRLHSLTLYYSLCYHSLFLFVIFYFHLSPYPLSLSIYLTLSFFLSVSLSHCVYTPFHFLNISTPFSSCLSLSETESKRERNKWKKKRGNRHSVIERQKESVRQTNKKR
ncbi:unnamed protein product [Acanthosepion pharaonis]|uniref:Uncharacterized protein n=1 Tax=Acanthosepion pharaonis TaxID=158019 RepID=A0A812CPQ3_ACAPH|nr:unnamed protein product [Sepia pharaonis]